MEWKLQIVMTSVVEEIKQAPSSNFKTPFLPDWLRVHFELGKQQNIAVLDGVRAIACLLVLIFHLNYLARETHIWVPIHDFGSIAGAFALAGESGVTLFFVLSGFLLFMPFAKALIFQGTWPSTLRFYLRRAFRIIPAYYVSLILIVIFAHPEYLQPDHWSRLGLFFVFFMDYPSTYQQINGPYWTLAVEAQFYLLLPLLTFGMYWFVKGGSVNSRRSKVALFLFGVIIWGVSSRYWGPYLYAHPDAISFIPSSVVNFLLTFIYGGTGKYLEDFAVGMLAASVYIYTQNPTSDDKLNNFLNRNSVAIFAIGSLIWVFMSLWHFNIWYYGYALHIFNPLHDYYNQYNEIGNAIGYGLIMLAVLYGSPLLKKTFEFPAIRWIGINSYSMYIWHAPLLIFFADFIVIPHMHGWHKSIAYLAFWVWTVLIILPFSNISYTWIERMGIRLGEKLQKTLNVGKQKRGSLIATQESRL